jgi:hypothetical protein
MVGVAGQIAAGGRGLARADAVDVAGRLQAAG